MTDLTKHYRQLVGIAKSWAMQNLPGWSDEAHRDLLGMHGAVAVDGRASATRMNVPQLGAVLDDYERRAWPRHKRVFKGAGHGGQAQKVPERIAHLVRLWGKLGQAGKVNNSSRAALLTFCARQVGRPVPNLDALSVAECQSVTEAIKGWLGR